jgi:hypothetical protein
MGLAELLAQPGMRALAGGAGLYLTGEDTFRLTTIGALAGAVVALEGRVMNPDGCVVPFAERHVPSSTYTATTQAIPVPEGILLNAQLRVTTGAAVRGHVFGILEIVRGGGSAAQPLGTILQGYLTSGARLAWPGSAIESSTAGVGRLRSITGTNPAAGVEISETVPAGVRWRLVAFQATLTTSAVVANRFPGILIDDGTLILLFSRSLAAQAASNSINHSWADWGAQSTALGSPNALPIPPGLVLAPGYRIRTSTAALDVGDDWTAPQYLVEEWIEV